MWRIQSDKQLTEVGDGKTSNIVWVPSDNAVFYRAALPPNQKQIWEKTVGFVLEDQLVDIVEDLHFVLGTPDDDETGIPVATLPLQLVEEWLQLLKDNSIKAQYIWFDFMAIPFDGAYDAVLWHEQGRSILRLEQQACAVGSLEWIFSLTKMRSSLIKIRVYSDDIAALPDEWQEQAEALPCSLEEKMLQFNQQRLPLNVMQGSICPEPAFMIWAKPWYGVAVTLIFLLGIYLAELGFELRGLKAQTIVLEKVTEKSFLEQFPDEQYLSDVRSQTARRLSMVSGSGDKQTAQLWQLMKKMDRILSNCKPCRVESLELNATTLVLDISSANDLEPVVEAIKILPGAKVSANNKEEQDKRKQVSIKVTMSAGDV